LVVNKKQTYRVYSEERLQLRQRNKKKLDRPRMPLVVPIGVNIRWSMDFVSDQLSNGRRFRVLNVKDDYSKELVGQLTAFSISGSQAARFLNLLIEQRSAVRLIRSPVTTALNLPAKRCFSGKKNRVSNWHLSSQANRLKMLLLKV
jgi:putative transposase